VGVPGVEDVFFAASEHLNSSIRGKQRMWVICYEDWGREGVPGLWAVHGTDAGRLKSIVVVQIDEYAMGRQPLRMNTPAHSSFLPPSLLNFITDILPHIKDSAIYLWSADSPLRNEIEDGNIHLDATPEITDTVTSARLADIWKQSRKNRRSEETRF
jgi:hypothetical protein